MSVESEADLRKELAELYARADSLDEVSGEVWLARTSALLGRMDPARKEEFRRLYERPDFRLVHGYTNAIWIRLRQMVADAIADLDLRSAHTVSSTRSTRECMCNVCNTKTAHTILRSVSWEGVEEIDGEYSFRFEQTFCICRCAGCGTGVVINEYTSDTTNGETEQEFYPPRNVRSRPDWLFRIRLVNLFSDNPKYDFLNQIYLALNGGMLRLAALGIRALLETIILEKIGDDQHSLRKNLEKFREDGFISKPQEAMLAKIFDFGSAVTHRSHLPNEEQVKTALDVTESLVKTLYVDAKQVEKALKNLPQRPRTKRRRPQ